jgi:hypothetical protein
MKTKMMTGRPLQQVPIRVLPTLIMTLALALALTLVCLASSSSNGSTPINAGTAPGNRAAASAVISVVPTAIAITGPAGVTAVPAAEQVPSSPRVAPQGEPGCSYPDYLSFYYGWLYSGRAEADSRLFFYEWRAWASRCGY